MAAKQISLKLLVHNEQNKVIYAESDNDFVDVLFSFLTMPIGTVVRLAGKQSKMGSISTLYEAVENLDMKFMQTEACKDMLLHPKSAAEEWRKKLRVDIDDTKPTEYYTCSWDCCLKTHHLTSTVDTSRCRCGLLMKMKLPKKNTEVVAGREDGVFVKGKMRYMIRDDLQVSPVSTTESLALLKKHGISDITVLEERDVNAGVGEVMDLLKCLFLSETPLTDVFLRGQDTIDGVGQDFKAMSLDSKGMPPSLIEKESGSDSKKMSVKLFMSKSKNKVLYAECGEEFPELLFSFLAFPLGSVVKVLGGFASLMCLNNLYNSVKLLSANNCVISEESEGMLLDPKLAPYFRCDMQPLQIQEQVPWQPIYFGCSGCKYFSLCDPDDTPHECTHGHKGKGVQLKDGRIQCTRLPPLRGLGKGRCTQPYPHFRREAVSLFEPATSRSQWSNLTVAPSPPFKGKGVQLSTINPKYPDVVNELGGTFTAGPAMFMVTDELNVKPSSPISGISLLSKYNVSISDLEEHVASVGEVEALSLLKASFVSRTALSDVFILKKPKRFPAGFYKRRPRRPALAREVKPSSDCLWDCEI